MIFDMGNSLAKAAAVDFGIQWACWAVAAALQTEKFFDLAGSSTFFYLALQSLRWNNTYFTRQKINTGMVMAWSARCAIVDFPHVYLSLTELSFTLTIVMATEIAGRFLGIISKYASYLVEAPIGTWTILYLALLTLKWNKTYFKRQRIVSWLAATWGFRLGLFLFTRILREGQDRRFNKVRNKPSVFFTFWTVQGIWVLASLLPTLILNSKKEDRPLTRKDYAGYCMWAIGFLLEVIADHQKTRFRSNPDNHNTFINQGLWSIVQYPNYLGEIMMWSGLYLSASSVLKGWEHIGVISPLLVTYLLTNVSGIPLQQRSALKKFGSDPAYQDYLKSTPKLLPFIW